ncbi:MAG: glycoside hydrolase family 76 protein [Alistipes sp.]
MKKIITSVLCTLLLAVACNGTEDENYDTGLRGGPVVSQNLAEQNLLRAMEIVDAAMPAYFEGSTLAMARYYNPYTGARSGEKGSVWMYTASIEAVNSILNALTVQKAQGETTLYDQHFQRYADLLAQLYDNADFYKGTFTLTSYTQTKPWTVYGVNRGAAKGTAEVAGIMNVYDDQQWLVRELFEAYKLTKNADFLKQAEYLTDYVLDGWDCALDANGKQYGGIPWGPGYVTKHSCSNGPMVSPLVWLHEFYKGKTDKVTYGYIKVGGARATKTVTKEAYYLEFAKAVYDYQKSHLLRKDGVYADMMGGDDTEGKVAYEEVDGVTYRKHTNLRDAVGDALSYNSGTMLSGAADLYRATKDATYLADLKALSAASFGYFAKLGETVADHYTYNVSGFNPWFNNVLMRAYVDAYPAHTAVAPYIDSFQKNLDYAYGRFYNKGMLPTNLLVGWNRDQGKNNTEGMFIFAYASEYATLARYELEKAN